MHIQYAIFCQKIELQPFPTLRRPLVALAGSPIEAVIDMEMPLFVTFIGGTPGHHKLTVEISDSAGRVVSVEDIEFDWPDNGRTAFAAVLKPRFRPQSYGIHTFLLSIEDSARAIPLEFKPAE